MGMQRVRNDEVWAQLRVLYMGAALLFLVNIYFGFDNALTTAAIPRWQLLIHLHAGSIGWITLSAVGLAIWVLTGDREVSDGYVRRTRLIVWGAVLVFAGYIPNFWLAFSRAGGSLIALLPTFGLLAVVVLWVAAVFALSQLRRQEVVTTVHILAAGALLVAAVGATMGALLGLERVLGNFLPITGPDRVGVHAGMMDTYLFLVASAIIEWGITRDPAPRWTWPGLFQGVAWGTAATLVPLAFLLDLFDVILPVFGLLLLVGLIVFLARVAWRALRIGPFGAGEGPWLFFGTAWLVVFLGLFLWAVSTGGDFASLPAWFFAAFSHTGFVGMMTNLILGVVSARAREQRHFLAWAEPAALWLTNLGIVAFIGLKIVADVRFGAIVMGLGVLLGVVTMLVRLGRATPRGAARTAPSP